MNLTTFTGKSKYQNLDNEKIDDIDMDESSSYTSYNKDSNEIRQNTINQLHHDDDDDNDNSRSKHHSILINNNYDNNSSKKIDNGYDVSHHSVKKKLIYTTTSIIINIILIIILIILSIQLNLHSCSKQSSSTSSSSPTSQPSSSSSSSSQFKSYEIKSKINTGVIATDTKICSDIGKDILLQGGNSVDAAIAATLCLGVLSPISSGLGGGCFILIHNHTTNHNIFIDSREIAPLSTYSEIFVNQSIKAQSGGLAIAVLSELKGLYYAYINYSNKKIKWKDLVLPSAKLAESWIISSELAYTMKKEVSKDLKSGEFALLSKFFLNEKNEIKKMGDVVQQPI